jgi:two-component system LytT family response regulator
MTAVGGQSLRAVIVDDEELARQILREYLSTHPEITVVAECTNGFEAVKVITEMKPDLAFLDIQMPKLNGFEVLDLLDEKPAVVFVTAYDNYALKAFEVHAVDYLLKPFTQERFNEALGRAVQAYAQRNALPVRELVASARMPGEVLERILIRDGSKVHVIQLEDIDYIEAQDDYAAVRSKGKSYLKHQPLTQLEALLDGRRFVRIHRSFILNVDRLSRIELAEKDSRVAILRDGARLPVSRTGYGKLKELL